MVTEDLFNVGRKKKRAPKPKSPYAAQIQHIMLRVYFALYSARVGEKPDVQPRHWALLRAMVEEHGPELVERRLRLFLSTSDPWVVHEAGFSLGVFRSQWQKLAAQDKALTWQTRSLGGMPQGTCQHQPPCPGGPSGAAHSRRMIEDLKGIPPTPSASPRTTSRPSDPF